jgi:formyl-CoA transferase
MQEAMTYYMRTRIAFSGEWGKGVTPRTGNNQGMPPVNLYPCKPFGPNDWVFMMPVTSQHWDELCVATDKPELLVDSRFLSPQARLEHRDALYEILSEWTVKHTKFEVMKILGTAGIPCSAVMDTRELHCDPHLLERGFIRNVEHPIHGEVPLLGFGPRLSASDVAIQRAPLLGEHTREVLETELGLQAEALQSLEDSGAIGCSS